MDATGFLGAKRSLQQSYNDSSSGRNPVLLVILPDRVDDDPVIGGEDDTVLKRNGLGQRRGPILQVPEEAFSIPLCRRHA